MRDPLLELRHMNYPVHSPWDVINLPEDVQKLIQIVNDLRDVVIHQDSQIEYLQRTVENMQCRDVKEI